MFRIDIPTATGTLPTPSAPGTPGYFTTGNQPLGIPATIVDQDWANRMQEELMSVLNQAGITPVKSSFVQLVAAIRACNLLNDVSTSVNVLIANPSPAWTSLVIGTQAVLVPAITNTGPATLNTSSGGGLQVLRPDATVVQPGDLPPTRRLPIIYDGAAWRLINWPSRIRLAQNLTLFCNAQTGNDNNNGLTLGTAFQTLTGVYSYIYQTFDVTGFTVTIQCSGNYTSSLLANNIIVGATVPGSIVFNFSAGSTISVTNDSAFKGFNPGVGYSVVGPVVISATGTANNAGAGVLAANDAQISINGVNFGACGYGHIVTNGFGIISCNGNYTISGNSPLHMYTLGGQISVGPITVNLTGTPAFSSAFAQASQSGAQIFVAGATYTGPATGVRYNAILNGTINTGTANATYLPGSGAGTLATGGQYA